MAAVGEALGARVERFTPVSGGDINQAFEATLGDGRTVFVKAHAPEPEGLFRAEARGLQWLAEAGALRVPQVLALSRADLPATAFLVLEHIPTGAPGAQFEEQLGRGLAALHRAGAPDFGFEADNFIGSLPQANAPVPTADGADDATRWAAFYAAQRIEPQLRRAHDAGLTSPALDQGCARLLPRLKGLVGPPEPPARLHGDLWAGNHLCDAQGAPVLVDPAVYGGHREVDLAMMRLFGGYGPRVFAAYAEAFPLAPGAEERVPLYQLYYLLVHVNLFGGGYVAQAEAAVRRLV